MLSGKITTFAGQLSKLHATYDNSAVACTDTRTHTQSSGALVNRTLRVLALMTSVEIKGGEVNVLPWVIKITAVPSSVQTKKH